MLFSFNDELFSVRLIISSHIDRHSPINIKMIDTNYFLLSFFVSMTIISYNTLVKSYLKDSIQVYVILL